MVVRFPHKITRGHSPFGSVSFITSQRLGAGSTLTGDDVDARWDRVKSFWFRGNQRGSWYVDATPIGTQYYGALFDGTFPAGQGSWKVVSFEEALKRCRPRIRAQVAGSYSIAYGGLAERAPSLG